MATMTEPRDKPSFSSLLRRARGRTEEDEAAVAPPPPPSRARVEAMPPPAPVAPQPAAASPARTGPVPRGEWSFEAMQFLVDPARVRIWPGNARTYARLTPANCRDLIASIAQEGMQKVAAIVRPVFDDEHYEYEVIAGTRRHFAISHLRAHGMPDLRYLVQVEILDDEAAFMLADLENRVRADVSEIERARSYAGALGTLYDGHVGRMAQRLAIPRETLVRMVRIADLPDEVVEAFTDPAELTLEPAFALAEAFDGPERERILATARQIARVQTARHNDGEPPYPPREIVAQLLGVEEDTLPPMAAAPLPMVPRPAPPEENAAELRGADGRVVLTMPAVRRDRLTFHVQAGSGATTGEVLDAVRAILEAAKESGFSLD